MNQNKENHNLPSFRCNPRKQPNISVVFDSCTSLTASSSSQSLRSAVKSTRARNKRRRESSGTTMSYNVRQTEDRKKRRSSENGQLLLSSSFSSVSGQRRRVRPLYEPPSVKRRKLLHTGQIRKAKTGNRSKPIGDRKPKTGSSFCPIQAAREEISQTIEQMEKGVGAKDIFHLCRENLQLCLCVWDWIDAQPAKVEVVVSRMALDLDVSARRLTRFLKGGNLLRPNDESMISEKLGAWLQEKGT